MWSFVRAARLPSLPPPMPGPEDEARFANADVTPEDFPFADRIRYYGDGEPFWRSLLRA